MTPRRRAGPPSRAEAAGRAGPAPDGEHIAVLLARHGPELARHLHRLVRDEDAAADLLQDTFLRAHAALGRLRRGSNARAWLYRIATNAALNHLRSRSREDAALRRHAAETDSAARAGLAAQSTPDRRPEDGARAALWARVAALPERQRVAITLRVADELGYAEIARRMGGSEAAARANVCQAMKHLKREKR